MHYDIRIVSKAYDYIYELPFSCIVYLGSMFPGAAAGVSIVYYPL